MLRKASISLAIVLGIVASLGLIAGDGQDSDRNGNPRNFIGLWEAIDSLDGSTQRLSVTCRDDDTCDVRLNDSLFSLSCPDQIGFARGDGSIVNGVLSAVLTLTCGDLTVSQFNEFVFDRRNGTLTNLNDDPGLPNVFHKVSR